MDFTFRPITKDNQEAVLNLKIKPSQESFIETVDQCLKEAMELSLWRPVGLYSQDVLIGFAMYGFWKNEGSEGRVWLDRFLIDQEQQGKGYARPVLKALINHMNQEYGCKKIYLSIYEDNFFAISIYQKMGFAFNGELDINGEKIMVMECKG